MGKKQKIAEPVTLPKPGEAFLMPLANGRFGVSRVLRGSTESEQPRTVRTASSWRDHPWMGDEAPDLKDGRIRRIQRLSHHSWKNQLDLTWVSDPPESYQKLGIIEPSAADKRRRSLSSGGWFSGQHLHMNWRWKHDREAVDREESAVEAEKVRYVQSQAHTGALRRHAEAKDALTLAGLRNKRRFSGWKGYAPDRVIPICRKIFRDIIDSLVELGDKPQEDLVLPILQSCIERLNDVDEQNKHFIETTIREELCEEFGEIVYACGLRDHGELADEWREW